MCGIVCAFDLKEKAEDLRPQLLEMSKKIRHRGPDWSGVYSDEKVIMTHERLAIVAGAQESQTSDSCAIITCRLFQRGEGWSTRMERYVEGGRLVERNVLTRPGQEDVVVVRSLLRPLPFE